MTLLSICDATRTMAHNLSIFMPQVTMLSAILFLIDGGSPPHLRPVSTLDCPASMEFFIMPQHLPKTTSNCWQHESPTASSTICSLYKRQLHAFLSGSGAARTMAHNLRLFMPQVSYLKGCHCIRTSNYCLFAVSLPDGWFVCNRHICQLLRCCIWVGCETLTLLLGGDV